MAYCAVPGCTSYQRRESDKNRSFHRFPSDQKARRDWIVQIRRDIGHSVQITDNTRVCSKHFTSDCIVRSLTGLRRIKPGSVPTLFTWCSELKPRRILQRNQSVYDIETVNEDEEQDQWFPENTGQESYSGCASLQDHDYLETSSSMEDQLKAAQKEIARLTQENENIRNQQFCLRRFQCEPKMISV